MLRQKPGSAKDVMFNTIEDEAEVANAIPWPDHYVARRRLMLSASMLACNVRVQRDGNVIHRHRPARGLVRFAAKRGQAG